MFRRSTSFLTPSIVHVANRLDRLDHYVFTLGLGYHRSLGNALLLAIKGMAFCARVLGIIGNGIFTRPERLLPAMVALYWDQDLHC